MGRGSPRKSLPPGQRWETHTERYGKTKRAEWSKSISLPALPLVGMPNTKNGETTHTGEHDCDPVMTSVDTASEPPLDPIIVSQRGQGFLSTSGITNMVKKEIKLSIEFPLKSGISNKDDALFFKRFMTVLFAANKAIQLKKWGKKATKTQSEKW